MISRLKQIVTPPVFTQDEDKTRTARHVYNLLQVVLIAAPLSVVLFALIAPASLPHVLVIVIPIPLAILMAAWMARRGWVEQGASLLLLVAWCAMVVNNYFSGGLRSPGFATGSILIIILAGLLLGRRGAFMTIMLNAVMVLAFAWVDSQPWMPRVPASVNIPSILTSHLLNMVVAGSLMYMSIGSIQDALVRARWELHERKSVEEERERLIGELRVKNAELEARTIEAAILRESAAAVALSLDLNETVSRILQQLQSRVPYDSASVQLLIRDELEIIGGLGFPEGKDPTGVRFKFDEDDPAFPILQNGLPYILYPDVQQSSNRFSGNFYEHIHSWLAVPLYARGRLIGLCTVDGTEINKFTEAHAHFAVIFANQVAVALDNSRLYSDLQLELKERRNVEKELREREVILDAVAASAEQLLKASEWRTVIDKILEELGMSIGASHAYIFEGHEGWHGETRVSIRHEWTAFSYPSDLENPLYHDMSLNTSGFERWRQLILQGQPFIGDAAHATPAEMEVIRQLGTKTLLEVPIHVNDQWWGIIGFDDAANARMWSNAEVDVLRVAANVLSAAIQRQAYDAALEHELEQRSRLIEELEQKNSELERFTYTVSHDLKSPLVTIKGFLGFLKQDIGSGNTKRLQEDINRIDGAVGRMEQLLNDLLELSRIGRIMNPPQNTPFGELVHEALEIVQWRLENRRIKVHVQQDLPVVSGDRRRLVEVLQNLLDNAAKYMGDQPEPAVFIGQQGERDGKPVFYVRDNGIGIAFEHHEKVFGLFNKLDPNMEGTGVGLALVKRIIEVHGGRIWVESESGKGSTFYFTLQPASD